MLGDVVMHKDTPEALLREIFARNDGYLVRRHQGDTSGRHQDQIWILETPRSDLDIVQKKSLRFLKKGRD